MPELDGSLSAQDEAQNSVNEEQVVDNEEVSTEGGEGSKRERSNTRDEEYERYRQERDQFSSKFAALTRKEREIKRKESEFQKQQQQYQTQLQEYEELKSLEKKILENPITFLEQKGINFEKLAEMKLNGDKPTPDMLVSQLKSEFQQMLDERLGKLESTYVEDKQQLEMQKTQEVIDDFKYDIQEHISQHKDKYELINVENNIEPVYQVIEEHFNATSQWDEDGTLVQAGELLSIEQAADLVEQELEKEVKRYAQAKKLQLERERANVEADGESPSVKQQSRTTSNTLSNDHATQMPTAGNEKLSREESIRRAAAMLKFDS